jgi:hypothetical protein
MKKPNDQKLPKGKSESKKTNNIPMGYHVMPDGKVMKNSAHKKR